MASARERMLARLAGMDLKRVFDLDGTGFIDPIVLTRSLKIWDSTIFTEENVEDFLKWSNLEKTPGAGSSTSRIINIQDMVGFVKARAPKLPRLRRRSASRASRSVASGASSVTEMQTHGSRVSDGDSAATMSFSAAPRSCRTREPADDTGARGSRMRLRSRSSSRPPQAPDEPPQEAAPQEQPAPEAELGNAAAVVAPPAQESTPAQEQVAAETVEQLVKDEAPSPTTAPTSTTIPTGDPIAAATAMEAVEEAVSSAAFSPEADEAEEVQQLAEPAEHIESEEKVPKEEASSPPEEEAKPAEEAKEEAALPAEVDAEPVKEAEAQPEETQPQNEAPKQEAELPQEDELPKEEAEPPKDEAELPKDEMGEAPVEVAAEGGLPASSSSEPLPAASSSSKDWLPKELREQTKLDLNSERLSELLQLAQQEAKSSGPSSAEDPLASEIHEKEPLKALEPPPDKLVARLANLNILRVLDVDGNGLIDREVFKCSLKIFDPEIFTEEGIDQLIAAATRASGVDDGKHLRILDLALYMGAPIFYPLTPEAIPEGDEGAEDKESLSSAVLDTEGIQNVPIVEEVPMPEGFATAEELFLKALDDQMYPGSSAPLTARTDVDSAAADPDTVRVSISELQDGAAGCMIPKHEMRGITLKQLRRLMHYVEEHCEREYWYDPETLEPLTPDRVDLFCLREWVLKPATKDRRCSYVELVASRASEQRPKWFVSHGAGSVADFIRCLSEHAKRHGFSDDVAYWVDAYAHNPWRQAEAEGAWEKALAISQGTVQIIGNGPVAYLEVGSHSIMDTDTDPYYGLRFMG
mmetsp:Transcript_122470/g.305824  ORF Transcript_122470/g.305824 Transcript_122470/m.305824 type:complete len:811 (+) Transcript_122470:125-2557(+)